MKKGFTLIELLAVIVLLAIIALIATPIVLNVINKVKINSLEISMSNIDKAVELYIYNSNLKENKILICKDGKCADNLDNKLELSGKIPDSGSINITKDGAITYNKLIIDGYLCDKYKDEFVCNKTSGNIKEVEQESIIIKNISTKLNNYKIYGNSIKNIELNKIENVGDKTNNLFDISQTTKFFISNNTADIPSSQANIKDGVITTNRGVYGRSIYFNTNIKMFKKGTYTFICDVMLENDDETVGKRGYIGYYAGGKAVYKGFLLNENNTWQTIITTFTFEEDTLIDGLQFQAMGSSYNYETINMKFKNIRILEGSYSSVNDDYEPYGYKIPVKVSGKNLIDYKKIISRNQSLYPLTINNDGSIKYVGDYYIKADCSNLKSGKTYVFSANFKINGEVSPPRTCTWKFLYSDGSVGSGAYIEKPITIDSNKQVENIYVYGKSGAGSYELEMWDIQIEEGTVATEYEPYIEPITTNIYLKEPLRKLNNYVDYIDYKNQKLIRNVGVLNLTSEDNFELIDNYFVLYLKDYPKKDKELSISNYLEYGKNFFYEGNKLKIKIDGINTVEEIKMFLNDKNVQIYYPLSKSIVDNIELPQINLNKNHSNISIDTNTKPSNFLIEYD